MSETEYQYQLETELEYLRAELQAISGRPFPDGEMNSLEAVKMARGLLRSHHEQQILINANKILADGLDQAFEKLKFCLKNHSATSQVTVPGDASLSELMDLAAKVIDVYYVKNVHLIQEIRNAMDSLNPVTLAAPHMTQNNWHYSKNGIIQALTLTLCGQVHDRLQRCYKACERFYQ